MEGLHLLLKAKVEAGLIKGVKVGNSNVNISHLFYADDAIIVADCDRVSLENTLAALNEFHDMSGLKINVAKSHLYGIGVDDLIIDSCVIDMGCSKGLLPSNVLRAKVGNGQSILFWKDNWLGNGSLKENGRLFHLDVNEDCLLADRFDTEGWKWVWKWDIGSRNTGKLEELITHIGEVSLSDS
ncbi:uncharacterized protein [Rutidosis leptorrhynchoides]|uniref:uncharacterized protein n=1 Tax=Rutidosis leptorrhynchoides TaxID=125765 RepID=UPI003A98E34D